MTNDTALTRYLYIRLYRADKPQRDGSILFYYYRGGAWDSILDAPSQRAGMVPLCHSDWYLYGILGVINFFESTSRLRSRVFPSEKHEFESLQDLQILSHLTRWAGRGNHTLPGSWYSTPPHPIPSHLIYLTLYKAHTIGRNIYSRHKAVLIFLWLIYQLIIIDLLNVGVVGVMR